MNRTSVCVLIALVAILSVAVIVVVGINLAWFGNLSWFGRYYLLEVKQDAYVGRLAFVQKIHGGSYFTVSSTELHFADDKVFTVSGDYDFPLNATLKVTYEYQQRSDGSINMLNAVKIEQTKRVGGTP